MPGTEVASVRLRELARRVTGGVEVALFWDEHAGTTTVSVWNWNSGVLLQFDTAPDRARYAFYHPYSSAAAHGVSNEDIRRLA
jgi:hypothetical protein